MKSKLVFLNLSSLFALAALLVFGQGNGPLAPPAPPADGVYKTLQQVEPRIQVGPDTTPGDADSLYRITSPGSYYLTGNLSGVAAKHGIEIASNNVGLDLGGFRLEGNLGSASLDAVSIGASFTNVEVHNGTIRSWTNGVLASGNNGSFHHLRVSHCTSIGLALGTESSIRDCVATQNGIGIVAGGGSTVTGCSASANETAGINANSATVTNCAARSNQGEGIVAQASTVEGCTANSNDGNGIDASAGCSVRGCTANTNDGNGIKAASGSSVRECTAQGNQGDGIEVATDCLVVGNNCSGNGAGADAAGIHATGAGNRIDRNNVTGSDRGIDVDVSNNWVVRNTAFDNTTDFDVALGVAFGELVNVGTPAVVSEQHGPWANFTH